MKRRLIFLTATMLAPLLATGCHGDAKGKATAAAVVAPITISATATPAPGVPAERAPNRAEAAKLAHAIPTALRGRWGMTPGDCDISRSDTKGLLIVSKDKLDFYESKARVDGLSKVSQNEVTADLMFSGEGKTWRAREHLRTGVAGTRLLRTEEAPHKTFRYVRC
ncbi:MAG: hypothetical protein ABIS14_10715 [Sphingomonas sp.]